MERPILDRTIGHLKDLKWGDWDCQKWIADGLYSIARV